MGLGIALVSASVAKLPVKIFDLNSKQIEKGLSFMDSLLEKDIVKNRITRDHANETKARITTSNSIHELSSADFVIEAVSENVDLKRKIFTELDEVTHKDTILATNTSSISITKIAAATKKPDKVIGMHFMNPVPVMKLVEIIPGLATSDRTLDVTKKLATSMGKTCTQSEDVPGFIANRLLMPYINEAVMVLEQGIATREDIDTTMKLGTNTPMGPLTLADFIGLDTCLAIMKVLHNEIGDTKYRPALLLQKYVDAGWLGKKTGRGFYEY
ncbi:3-hydroxyacyl-CoA dehydrogenase [Glomus cerebriforme]|uniref:3-hydroxyacyl-CoA dehydrogenase n=1 Tax=Glomus cerebriforme TaxID=658196 RepID=A0A397TIX5_9GLOM|nr:3-hydroxyacyl-CoA dehydrogenase [Glomus cerebriforme]